VEIGAHALNHEGRYLCLVFQDLVIFNEPARESRIFPYTQRREDPIILVGA